MNVSPRFHCFQSFIEGQVRARLIASSCAASLLRASLLLLVAGGAQASAQEPVLSAPVEKKTNVVTAPTPSWQVKSAEDALNPPAGAATTAGPITGRVLGDDGQPLAGIMVSANARSGGGMVRQPPPMATTGEDGRFRFENLEPNVYTIWAYAPGYVMERNPFSERTGIDYQRIGDSVTIRMIKGGVITGTVLDASGDPVVAVTVRAFRVRDLEGQPPREGRGIPYTFDQQADDRGVYRLYGLEPGVYVVAASGNSQNSWGPPGAYDSDAPTFFPSGTRDTAAEVTVMNGQEVSGIDIRYRGERGHSVSGTLDASSEQQLNDFGTSITLTHAASGIPAGVTWLSGRDAERSFSFDGIADGDYDLQARRQTRSGEGSASSVQRVTVRGTDITGLKLTLTLLGSASGQLALEPMREAERTGGACAQVPRRRLLPQETVVLLRRDERGAAQNSVRSRLSLRAESTPNEGGEFKFATLEGGRYHLAARPLDENWYVRFIQTPAAPVSSPAPKKPGAARAGTPATVAQRSVAASVEAFDLKPGQQLSGLSVRVAEGAASFSGRVVPNTEGAQLLHPAQTRLHLVPAEREQAYNPLRFAETFLRGDGSFTFTNLAPGRYLLVVRMPAGNETPEAVKRLAAWDAEARAGLRREAEAANTAVEFQPCQRTSDYALRFPQALNK